MAAATQASLATSAAVFAGGLAVGIGGAIALSRASFAPASKLNNNTKQKARKALELPSDNKLSVSEAQPHVPASVHLDAVDAKGAGPAAPAANPAAVVKPLIVNAQKNSTSVTGKQVFPEPSANNRQKDTNTKMDLLQYGGESPDASAVEDPVWLTGLQESNQLNTSTGRIDKLAYQSSNAVFVYESDANAGFGAWSEQQAKDAATKVSSDVLAHLPKVFSMQTRAGAGAAIAGYMSEKGTSSAAQATGVIDANQQKTVTALTNADGFLTMAPSLALTAQHESSRLVLQVSAASQEKDLITNNYSSVLSAASTISHLSEDFSIVLSGDRQEAVDIASVCYQSHVRGNVAHIFDGAYGGRELAKLQAPQPAQLPAPASVSEALRAAGLPEFAYEGAAEPKTLIVVPNGSHAVAAKAVYQRASSEVKQDIGIVSVRVLRPWSDEDLLKFVKPSVERIHVIDEVRVPGLPGVLYEDVQAAVLANLHGDSTPVVQPVALHAGESLSAFQWKTLLSAASSSATKWQLDLDAIKSVAAVDSPLLTDNHTHLLTFFDSEASTTSHTGPLLARLFRDRNSDVRSSRILSRYDNFAASGIVRHDVILSTPDTTKDADLSPLPLSAQPSETKTLVIGDAASVLKSYDVFSSLAAGGLVLINAPGWDGEELAAKLRAEDKRTLASKGARVYIVDATKVVDKLHDATAKAYGGKHKVGNQVPKETAAPVLLASVLAKHMNATPSTVKALFSKVLGAAPLGVNGVSGLVDGTASGIQLVAFSNQTWIKSEPVNDTEASAPARPIDFAYNGYGPSVHAATVGLDPVPTRATWALPAWQTMFAESYNTDRAALRPDLPEENYVLTVTENRRLTPLDYDRNVFHLEFSTAGTGLKYEVGEALGIHGWNDADEVAQFIRDSGYNPDEIVSIASLSDPSRYESRTVFQVLQQRLDIFGKPGKHFYEVLSKLATDPDEAKWLRFISSAEGQSTFKKLSEVETVTYADVLQMFPSARLPLDVLLAEVEAIKPRHYSIASAQSFVGDSVHLLIVTVDWTTPSGSPRYGQCTRYLANLHVGDTVTVSLKPSVMKLPPFTKQPIVMSGLGTGAAPFRAYLQARAVQKRLGHEIGPMIYIFGSRYKHAEYLYGEELEAYEKDGIVKVLTAFSRDQKNKIYIQHRIEQNQAEILDLLVPASGSGKDVHGMFTLCGPTDPLPDVQEALIQGYMAKTGKSHQDGEAWLEELKEDERAVYEVY